MLCLYHNNITGTHEAMVVDQAALASVLQRLCAHPTLASAIPRRTVRALANAVKEHVLDAPAAAAALCTLAALKHADGELLDALCATVSANITTLPPERLVRVLSAASALGHRDPRLVDGIVGALLWHVSVLPTACLADIVCSLATLQHKDAMTDVLLDAVAEAGIKRMARFGPNELSRMVLGFAQLEHWGPMDARLQENMLCTMLTRHQVRGCGDNGQSHVCHTGAGAPVNRGRGRGVCQD